MQREQTHNNNNNRENAFKQADEDQLYLSFYTQHKSLHVFMAEQLGSYNCAFCFILVKVRRKTRGECFKMGRQIKHADQKDRSKYPSGIEFDSAFDFEHSKLL